MTDVIVKIAIAEPSAIIRAGISSLLKRIQGYHVHSFEVNSIELLANNIRTQKPDIVIINPTYWGLIDVEKLKTENSQTQIRFVALVSGMIDEKALEKYDNSINLYDDTDTIKQKLDHIFEITNTEQEESQVLSVREKEIIVGVVKGFTNKEIASNLFLSAHTVITHRRNIARKLEIHSTAGLTIYAIVNKLVELNDIKQR
jgi:DNA-binding NarL/FixJ family response regulator